MKTPLDKIICKHCKTKLGDDYRAFEVGKPPEKSECYVCKMKGLTDEERVTLSKLTKGKSEKYEFENKKNKSIKGILYTSKDIPAIIKSGRERGFEAETILESIEAYLTGSKYD